VLKTVTFIRHNAIALLALFVALGGTSYAALSLPAGSVGTKQLRNHSITPIKLDPGSIGGYIRFWARVSAGGRLIASSPRAKVLVWYKPPSSFSGGQLRWSARAPAGCFAIATVDRQCERGHGDRTQGIRNAGPDRSLITAPGERRRHLSTAVNEWA
jgi:hypothetical protein